MRWDEREEELRSSCEGYRCGRRRLWSVSTIPVIAQRTWAVIWPNTQRVQMLSVTATPFYPVCTVLVDAIVVVYLFHASSSHIQYEGRQWQVTDWYVKLARCGGIIQAESEPRYWLSAEFNTPLWTSFLSHIVYMKRHVRIEVVPKCRVLEIFKWSSLNHNSTVFLRLPVFCTFNVYWSHMGLHLS